MRLIDISMEVKAAMKVYKGRDAKRPVITIDSDFSTGSVYESRLQMNLHTGTHIDAPLHMIKGGATTGPVSLEQVARKCKVFDFSRVRETITRTELADKKIESGDFVLLKTRNSTEDILEGDYVYLEESGAAYLRDRGVAGAGIDALSIERGLKDHPAHIILLSAGIVILEGLRLGHVEEGEYFLAAAPLKIAGVEAAPVRAFLITAF